LIRVLDRVDDSHKLVSSLAALEVRSALRRRERAGEIPPLAAKKALESLANEIIRIVEQPISQAIVEKAKLILDDHPLRTLDALHLATCIVLRDSLDVSGMYFVSSDDTLLQAAAAEQFLVRNPLKL
jgi:predicted nucleic acid-binding protein